MCANFFRCLNSGKYLVAGTIQEVYKSFCSDLHYVYSHSLQRRIMQTVSVFFRTIIIAHLKLAVKTLFNLTLIKAISSKNLL